MSESNTEQEHRPLGDNGMTVAPVALGCWPMAGVTTLGATHDDGVATVHAALDAGINHLDTAYVYGPDGESDRILAEALRERRDEAVLASKVGIHYQAGPDGKPGMAADGRPETIRRECDKLLGRLGTDRIELLYLHSPDPETPIAESAGALAELRDDGKARAIGASNCTLEQIEEFAAVCPLAAVQLPYNLLQRDIEELTIPWCRERGVAVMAYWPLMKGLLAGKMGRDHRLPEGDSRNSYPMYRGDEWRRNQDFLDDLRTIAEASDRTVAQLVVNWTMNRPGVTAALCGAKRPTQIAESAGAMGWRLSEDQLAAIDAALARRGQAEAKRSFR